MRFPVLSHHFLINLFFSQLQVHLYLAQSLRFIILTQPRKYLYFLDFSPMIVLVSQNLNFEKRLPSPFSVPYRSSYILLEETTPLKLAGFTLKLKDQIDI